jgi:hypothetical protein
MLENNCLIFYRNNFLPVLLRPFPCFNIDTILNHCWPQSFLQYYKGSLLSFFYSSIPDYWYDTGTVQYHNDPIPYLSTRSLLAPSLTSILLHHCWRHRLPQYYYIIAGAIPYLNTTTSLLAPSLTSILLHHCWRHPLPQYYYIIAGAIANSYIIEGGK